MIDSLVRHLDDCRRRVIQLDELHLSDPMYVGWIDLSSYSDLTNTPLVIGTLTRQAAYFYESIDLERGSDCFFFYSTSTAIGIDPPPHVMEKQCHLFNPVGRELSSLCDRLPGKVRNTLLLPAKSPWWNTLLHLAVHFPQAQRLEAHRKRLIKERFGANPVNERFIQLSYHQPHDVYPGLVYAVLCNNVYTSTIAAIDFLKDQLASQHEDHQTVILKDVYLQLQKEFQQISTLLDGSEHEQNIFKIIKCTNSFVSPPAREWAEYPTEGHPKNITLSSFGSEWEFAVFSGLADEDCLQLCQRAGEHLPRSFGNHPVMFTRQDSSSSGLTRTGYSPAVLSQVPEARWIRHVVATLRQFQPEFVETVWCSKPEEFHKFYGYTRLKTDICTASVLCIRLSGLIGNASASRAKKQQSPVVRGRPSLTDRKSDAQIWAAWKTGAYKSYKECGNKLNLTANQVELVIDRHRKWLKRGKRSSE